MRYPDINISGIAWLELQGITAGVYPEAINPELVTVGLIQGGEFTPLGLSMLQPLLDEWHLVVRLATRTEADYREASCWIAANRTAICALNIGDDIRLRYCDAGAFPAMLALLLGLQPRPTPTLAQQHSLATRLLNSMLNDAPGAASTLSRHLLDVWPEISESLGRGAWRASFVEAFDFRASKLTPRGSVIAIDTENGVLGVAPPDGSKTAVIQVSTSQWWSALAALTGPAA